MRPSDIEMPKIKVPKIRDIPTLIRLKLKEYKRVYSITKKPEMKEYQSIVKVTGLGIIVIGIIGFVVFLIVEMLERL